MSDNNLCAVLLAAGEGKRMRSNKPKVLCEVLLKPMLGWVMDSAKDAGIGDICVVTGHMEEQVKAYLGGSAETVTQSERLGTGHAVMMAKEFLEKHRGGDVLVACGDAPFLDTKTISKALRQHLSRGDAVTVISASLEDPTGYGRIIRGADGALERIVEQKDANAEEWDVKEVNSGAYWFNIDALLEVLDPDIIGKSEITGEYYLTNTPAALLARGYHAGAYEARTPDVVLGANDPKQLYNLGKLARQSIIMKHIENGVSIPCTGSIIISPDVEIGPYAQVLPGSVITGKTVIGSDCKIGPHSVIENSVIGSGSVINASQVKNATVEENSVVGPFEVIGK